MSALVLRDIGELITLVPGQGAGAEAALGLCHDAEVVIADGRVVYAGPRSGAPAGLAGPVTSVSVHGGLVSPGLCDPHTHPIWAGDRGVEFDLRNQGRSYAEIQQAGGGILSTVAATAAASDGELVRRTRAVLGHMLRHGTTLCEGKTGYGLTPQAELRLLRLLAQAAAPEGRAHGPVPVQVAPTLLCHMPPPGLAPSERAALVGGLCAAMPAAKAGGALAVDVYCDQGAFDLRETEALLRAGRDAGLLLRCHAEQFTRTGAAALAAGLGAVSVEHLEEIDEAGIAALARAGTVANLLPGAALTLRLRWPDGRRLIDQGVTVALGTDSNPGSSLSESLPLMMSLGCTQMGLTCAEAWLAVTVHAQRAVLGAAAPAPHLGPEQPATLVVWRAGTYREVCQHLGAQLCQAVLVDGELVYGELGASQFFTSGTNVVYGPGAS